MTERIISLLALIVAIAHLATDVLHFASEASPRRNMDERTPIPRRHDGQEMPRAPPRLIPPQAPGDWSSEDHPPPTHWSFRPLPPDFSINHPPWCPACRYHDPPRTDGRYRY
jgi:hypothetical protein